MVRTHGGPLHIVLDEGPDPRTVKGGDLMWPSTNYFRLLCLCLRRADRYRGIMFLGVYAVYMSVCDSVCL